MARHISIAVDIDAPIERVWERLADISDHTTWMVDANEIVFVGDRRTGVGTTFDCFTGVGPLRLRDRMTVIEWEPPHTLGVHHEGVVLGDGWFRLSALDERRTRFTWEERVRLRRRFGGAPGWFVATPVLRRVWKLNLDRFARSFG